MRLSSLEMSKQYWSPNASPPHLVSSACRHYVPNPCFSPLSLRFRLLPNNAGRRGRGGEGMLMMKM